MSSWECVVATDTESPGKNVLTFEADDTSAKTFFFYRLNFTNFRFHILQSLCIGYMTAQFTSLFATSCNLLLCRLKKIDLHAYWFPGVFLIAYFYTHTYTHRKLCVLMTRIETCLVPHRIQCFRVKRQVIHDTQVKYPR